VEQSGSQKRGRPIKSVTLDPRVVEVVNARRHQTLETFSKALGELALLGAQAPQQVQG
jgi:hypothetical protein